MSKALARRKKNPIARRRKNPGVTYTTAALIGLVAGSVGGALGYTDPPRPPSRLKAGVRGALTGAVILTISALLYREYQVYGV